MSQVRIGSQVWISSEMWIGSEMWISSQMWLSCLVLTRGLGTRFKFVECKDMSGR